MSSATEELLPCPFCGGKATLVKMPHINAPGLGYVVECDECWSKTGYYDSRREAVEAWNRRADRMTEHADGIHDVAKRLKAFYADEPDLHGQRVLAAIDQLRRDLSGYHGQLKAHSDLQVHCDRQRERIADLEGLYIKVKAENARLRELVKDLYFDLLGEMPESMLEDRRLQMRELGIEVDG